MYYPMRTASANETSETLVPIHICINMYMIVILRDRGMDTSFFLYSLKMATAGTVLLSRNDEQDLSALLETDNHHRGVIADS